MAHCRLIGCAKKYDCKPIAPLREPIEGFIMAPWVKVRLAIGGTSVTVGNESFNHPDKRKKNHAIIKSMEYGSMNGHEGIIEILDEEGSTFIQFYDRLAKDIKNSSDDVTLQLQFGWISSFCGQEPTLTKSPIINLQPNKMEIKVSEGVIRYIITAQSLVQPIFLSRATEVKGAEDQKISLKKAIKRLFADNEPKMKVKFLKTNKGSPPSTYDIKPNPPDGPLGYWHSDNQNKLAVAMDWLAAYRTTDDKGIVPAIDNLDGNTMIFWEDHLPNCNGVFSCGSRTLGTYIVNGGGCSPVISFSPTIAMMQGLSQLAGAGGSVGGPASARQKSKESVIADGDCKVQQKNAGLSTWLATFANAFNIWTPKEVIKETSKSQDAHNKANAIDLNFVPIEAELKIQGNPIRQFVDLSELKATFVSIVVINPFHLVGDPRLKIFLALPACNEVLSNKGWLVLGVNHSIREGSYVTTLKLSLWAPGYNASSDSPLGGKGSGGYKQDPKNS